MSKLLRYFAPGQNCFITSVTANRKPILTRHTRLLARAVHRARQKSEFSVIAWVVLPDHVHALLFTPNGDTAKVMQRVKLSFSLLLGRVSGERGPFWQHRYWDHVIRSPKDLRRHLDYIHYNPVKHGLSDSPVDWKLSSYRKYVRNGLYAPDWGAPPKEITDTSFGE